MNKLFDKQVEIDEESAKNKLVEVLNRPFVDGQIPVQITCKSSVTEHASKYELNFAFYKIFEPLMVDAKILDLFCGGNNAKLYLKQHNLPGEVTGVDIEDERADIKADVAKLTEKLKPEGQFDIVTSLGAFMDFERYADDAAYLKKDGLYVYGMTEDWLDKNLKANIIAWVNGEYDKINNPMVKGASKYFQIIAILKINDIHLVIDWPEFERTEVSANEYYIVCKKAH